MYYEEKIINGVLMCRRNPKGGWEQCSITKMSRDIVDLKRQLATIKQDSIAVLEEALKAMLINGFSEDCVPVVKVKYQIKKLKE